jgi:L-histidine N-alpha-methyltransferase
MRDVAAVQGLIDRRGDTDRRIMDPMVRASVLHGLRQQPKRISPIWFYDERGSQLFDRICELPEYYVTRSELAILQGHLDQIATSLGSELCVIEPGSGTSLKTRLLLAALERPAAYVPVDVAHEHLEVAAAALRREHPDLVVHPVCADFTLPFHVPGGEPFRNRMVYFPGSTIGNFAREEAVRLLAHLRRVARGGAMLIGVDLVKDLDLLIPAYDDGCGVTAQFNLNALEHMNRRLGSDFDPAAFRHRAVWNERESRIEMHLVSRRHQRVRIGGETIAFANGESLVSEYSHKYTPESFANLAASAGWRVEQVWTDARRWFSVQKLVPSYTRLRDEHDREEEIADGPLPAQAAAEERVALLGPRVV